jgi:esterase/lipase
MGENDLMEKAVFLLEATEESLIEDIQEFELIIKARKDDLVNLQNAIKIIKEVDHG